MATTAGVQKLPVHRKAWTGFIASLFALLLAWYGSLHAEKHLPDSPLLAARGIPRVPAEPGPWYEKIWDRSETTLFGGRVDQKIRGITERSKFARCSLQVIAFGLPFVLGIASALLGASALKSIEQSRGVFAGNFQAVFSILIGGFASVIAGCMIVSIYVWPQMPSLYTQ
ncbi:MAG TPA: hypothetical protein VG097_10510 [Gemmata sp.]|jgi:hypothetical protein|nr:hypothetical protein [Gemmata sp.]